MPSGDADDMPVRRRRERRGVSRNRITVTVAAMVTQLLSGACLAPASAPAALPAKKRHVRAQTAAMLYLFFFSTSEHADRGPLAV